MFDDTSPLLEVPHKRRLAPIHELNHQHDLHPLWRHKYSRVPGVGRLQARRARAAALIQAHVEERG